MRKSLDRIAELLAACGTPGGVMPPTGLYNEGWMLRLVLDAYTRLSRCELSLKPAPGARWYSEVLLPSRFLPRSRRDNLAEGWTHADAVVGHFSLKPDGRGDIQLSPDASQLVVVEAKMFSPLSVGTARAPGFNQAARNVACMAHIVADAKGSLERLREFAFVVLAPKKQLSLPEFANVVDKDMIARVVRDRVLSYGEAHTSWHEESYVPAHSRVDVRPIAWEDAIEEIGSQDPDYADELRAFYAECVRFNDPASRRPVRSPRSV